MARPGGHAKTVLDRNGFDQRPHGLPRRRRRLHFDQHPHAILIQRLYDALARADGAAMAACYTPDATFSDPVFPDLQGQEVGAMWRMLTARSRDLQVEVRDVVASATDGTATWEARYTFAATGRAVRNVGNAVFTFRDGRIASHTDTWSFAAWATQAFGWRGKLLGKTSLLRGKVRRQARASLERMLARESAGPADASSR